MHRPNFGRNLGNSIVGQRNICSLSSKCKELVVRKSIANDRKGRIIGGIIDNQNAVLAVIFESVVG